MASDPFNHVALSAENLFIPDLEDMSEAGLAALAQDLARAEDVTGTIHLLLSALQERARDLKHLNIDPLTELLNRRGFGRILKHEVDRNEREMFRQGESRLCLIYGDLTGFKAINDKYGHAVGDDALRHVSGILKYATRVTDYVVRCGGDEFCVLLPDCNAAQAEQVALRITDKLNEMPFKNDGVPIFLSINMGVVLHEKGERPDDFVDRSDALMMENKAADYKARRTRRSGDGPSGP